MLQAGHLNAKKRRQQDSDQKLKNLRILTIYYIQVVLEKALNLMGIPQPERM